MPNIRPYFMSFKGKALAVIVTSLPVCGRIAIFPLLSKGTAVKGGL